MKAWSTWSRFKRSLIYGIYTDYDVDMNAVFIAFFIVHVDIGIILYIGRGILNLIPSCDMVKSLNSENSA